MSAAVCMAAATSSFGLVAATTVPTSIIHVPPMKAPR